MNYFTREKHYNTLNNYYRQIYGEKIFKVALNGNFTCPNIDGTAGYGGCTFCSPSGSGDFAGEKYEPLKQQFEKIKNIMHNKWPKAKYIVYFQANTNTYGSLDKLKSLFEEAITLDPNIVMISIATRPDCLPIDVLDYLEDLNNRMPVQVELGLQTIHNKTAKEINRGHDLLVFEEAVKELRKRKIEVVVHIINGLPCETTKMMIETATYLNNFDIQGVKIHMLHIMFKTKMGFDYLKAPWPMLTLAEYVYLVSEQLRRLNGNFIIHRLSGDAPKALLIEPKWTLKKFIVNNEIDKYMRNNNYYQGDLYEK